MAGDLFDSAVAPAVSADGYVAIVASDFDLFAFGDYFAMGVDAGVDDCLAAAVAGRLDFVDCVGDLKETARAFEEVGLEVGAQTVAHDVDREFVDGAGELVDLGGGQELSFIDEDPFRFRIVVRDHYIAEEEKEVGVRIYPGTFAFDADSRADDVLCVAGVDDGLHAEIAHSSFLEVIGGCQQ